MAPRRTHRGSSGPPSGGRARGERSIRKPPPGGTPSSGGGFRRFLLLLLMLASLVGLLVAITKGNR